MNDENQKQELMIAMPLYSTKTRIREVNMSDERGRKEVTPEKVCKVERKTY